MTSRTRIGSRVLLLATIALSCTPLQAQILQGGVVLTYDPGTLSIVPFAWTELDGSYTEYYEVKVSMWIYRHVVEFQGYTAFSPVSATLTPPDIPAYPGTTYTATAEYSVEMVSECPNGWCDPYEIGFLTYMAVQTNYFSENLSFDSEFTTSIEEKDAGESIASVGTPPAALNVQTGANTMLIDNGVASTSSACPTTNPAADHGTSTCTFFVAVDSNDTPQVPTLQSWLTGVNANLPLQWGVSLNYTRSDSNCSGSFYHDSIPIRWQSVSASSRFDIRAALGLQNPSNVQGGNLSLSWQIGDASPAPDVTFGLWGIDPRQSSIVSRVNSNPASPWYALYIIKEESTEHGSPYHQFNFINGYNGTPNWGPPCGFGLSQQDPPGQFTNSKAAVVWNWQANVDDGIKEMNEKQAIGVRSWSASDQAWRVDRDPSRQDPPCAIEVGGATHHETFCYDTSKGRSWADANAIKCYNGCERAYIRYNTGTHKWEFSTYAPESGYYVQKVMNQVIP